MLTCKNLQDNKRFFTTQQDKQQGWVSEQQWAPKKKKREHSYGTWQGIAQNYLPMYNWCSPGSTMSNAPPTSELDYICWNHDKCYAKMQLAGQDPFRGQENDCDRAMIQEVGQTNFKTKMDRAVAPFAKNLISLKHWYNRNFGTSKQTTLPQHGFISTKTTARGGPTNKSSSSTHDMAGRRTRGKRVARSRRRIPKRRKTYSNKNSRVFRRRSYGTRRRYGYRRYRRYGRRSSKPAAWMAQPIKYTQFYSVQCRADQNYYGFVATPKLGTIEDLKSLAAGCLEIADVTSSTTNAAKIIQICHASMHMIMTNGGAQPLKVSVYAFKPRKDLPTIDSPDAVYGRAILEDIQHNSGTPCSTQDAVNLNMNYTFSDARPRLTRFWKMKRIYSGLLQSNATAVIDYKMRKNSYWNYSKFLEQVMPGVTEYPIELRYAKNLTVVFYVRIHGMPGHGVNWTGATPVNETTLINTHPAVLDIICKETYYARNIPGRDYQRRVYYRAVDSGAGTDSERRPITVHGLAHPDATGHDIDKDAMDVTVSS